MGSVVYFVQDPSTAEIKIGTTKYFEARLRYLSKVRFISLRPIVLMYGSFEEEHDLHDIFSELRTKGEWFSPEEHLLWFLSDLSYGGERASDAMLAELGYSREIRSFGILEYVPTPFRLRSVGLS
jgi:T5orf172 domain